MRFAQFIALVAVALTPTSSGARDRCTADTIQVLRRALVNAREEHAPFYRIVIDEKPRTRKGMHELEELYGTTHLLFESDLKKLKKPLSVDGYVWYDSVGQFDLVRSTKGANFTPGQMSWARKWASDKGEDIGKIFRKYAPDAIAKSEELTDLIKDIDLAKLSKDEALAALQKKLHEEFPSGFVVKLKEGWSSDGAFPGEKHDFAKVYEDYVKNVKPRKLAMEAKGLSPEEVHLTLKGTPNYYEGMELEEFLEGRAKSLYVEERVKIARGTTYRNHEGKLVAREKEFRVIVDSDGKVVSSMHRWDERRLLADSDTESAAKFVQTVNDRFPPELRFQSGWDVVQLEDGRWKVMERNITEVGDLYPDINTHTTQQIAVRRVGNTGIQDAFYDVLDAKGLDAMEEKLAAFLDHDGIRALVKDRSALTEYLVAIKKALLQELAKEPTAENTRKLLRIVRKHKLGDQFTRVEVEALSDQALKAGIPISQVRRVFEDKTEYLYVNAAGKSQLALLPYDDQEIEELVTRRVIQNLGQGPKRKSATALAKAIAKECDDFIYAPVASDTELSPLEDSTTRVYHQSRKKLEEKVRKRLLDTP